MCEVCDIYPEKKKLKVRIKEIYQEIYQEYLDDYSYDGGKPSKAKKKEMMREAEQQAEEETHYDSGGGYYGDEDVPGVSAVNCCGVREMSAAQAQCERGFKLVRTQVAKDGRFGFLFATTTHRQLTEAGALEARRFKRVGEFTNPNTGNRVTFWTYNIHPVKKEKNGEKKRNARLAA